MKYQLNRTTGTPVILDAERILTNDVTFEGEFNPHQVRLWLVGNEYGALAAAWAAHESEALDVACDAGLLRALLVDNLTLKDMDPEDVRELTAIGNAGEPADLTYAWIEVLPLEKQPLVFLLKLAEARGACVENLDKI